MQNQPSNVPTAKPKKPRLARRVAASFNHTVQRTEASRFAQKPIERQGRLASVADLCVRRQREPRRGGLSKLA